MLILYEYFNIIWQKDQGYDPCLSHMHNQQLNLGVTTFSNGFFIIDLWSETIPGKTEIKYTNQGGYAHSNCETLKINK